MKINKEIKTITQEVITYIADDGKVFFTEVDCKKYEREQELKKYIEAAEKLRIEELDDVMPIDDNGYPEENNTFTWYELKDKNDFEIVNKAYSKLYGSDESITYPEIICFETYGYEPYINEAYYYTLTNCKTITENFWKKFGYEIEFRKIGEY